MFIATVCALSIVSLLREELLLPRYDISPPPAEDAKSAAGAKILPIRHARVDRSVPIKDRLVKIIGCLLAQAISFSGNANKYADNVVTDEANTVSVRGIG
jgi:hypothetical protein